jgi:hypothetical protein
MALDRTWYNSLVDDDGSGLTGSIWDKADVNALMNTIDSEILRLETGVVWTPFTPALYASAGVWSASSPLVKYRRHQKSFTLMFSIEGGSLSAVTTDISIQLPLSAAAWAGYPANPCILGFGGSQEIAPALIPAAKSVVTIYRPLGQTFPIGALTVRGQIHFEVS